MSGEEWRTPNFRQTVVVKIDEAIQKSGMATVKKGIEMESHVFQKAKTKEEYLGFVARLILHVRELNSKKGGAMPGNNVNNMQDPINALQNLARQGSGNQMMGGVLPPPIPQQNNPASKDVIKTWRNTRDSYQKSLGRTKVAKKSGADARKTKSYINYSQLRLRNQMTDNLTRFDDRTKLSKTLKVSNRSNEQLSTSQLTVADTSVQTSKQNLKIEASKIRKIDSEKLNRHQSFLNGILPSLETLDDLEVLEFQMKVLRLLKSIKERKNKIPVVRNVGRILKSPSTVQGQQGKSVSINQGKDTLNAPRLLKRRWSD